MIINKNPQPISSFLSVDKDLSIIVDKLIKDERFKRLVYYNSADALDKKNLTEDESLSLFGKNIKIIPKLYIDKDVLSYVIIRFDDFVPNGENPEFRDNSIVFDIVCHFSTWYLKDFSLRPYKIAAEIDSLFNNQRLTGIGKLQFQGGDVNNINNEYGVLTLVYDAIHGGEDKKNLPNPIDNDRFLQDFADMINAE